MMTGRDEGWRWWVCRGVVVLALVAAPAIARAQQKGSAGSGGSGSEDLRQRVERLEAQLKERTGGAQLGGHFGFVLPLAIWEAGHSTTTINEDFQIGFPMGITVKKGGPWAFDLEFVPSINDHDVNLTVHPGVLYAIDDDWTAGLRIGYDIDQHSWGPTPLINRKLFDITDGMHAFVELPMPFRIKEDSWTFAAALHFGVGF